MYNPEFRNLVFEYLESQEGKELLSALKEYGNVDFYIEHDHGEHLQLTVYRASKDEMLSSLSFIDYQVLCKLHGHVRHGLLKVFKNAIDNIISDILYKQTGIRTTA